MPAISVIIAARDAAATLPRTLDALADQDLDEDVEVIVVDNGSQDATAELAERHPAVTTLLRRPRGDGPGPARNDGAAAASARALAFTDADCFPTPGWLRAGLTALETAALVQGRVEPDPSVPLGLWDRSLWIRSDEGLYQTANLFVTAEAFVAAGGFPRGLEGPEDSPFGEDVLFGWSVRRAAFCSAYSDEALVHHAVFPRDPLAFIAERRRLVLFPALARAAPELRRTFLHRGWFVTSRAAAFDAAVAGTVLAVGARRRLPLLAGAPYARRVWADLRTSGAKAAAIAAAADVVGARALLTGSVRARRVVG